MNYRNSIELSQFEVGIILDHNLDSLNLAVKTTYCPHCDGSEGNKKTEIIDCSIYLEPSNDILLKGKCKSCMHSVERLIETGEMKDIQDKVIRILQLRKKHKLIK